MADNRLGSLAKQTAIYGLSSIIGRFLNYMLVPVYTFKIALKLAVRQHTASSPTYMPTQPCSWFS